MIIDVSEDGYTVTWESMVTGTRRSATIVQLIEAFEAEPIVRCKDCKYAKKYMMSYGYKCTWDGLARNSFDFCSDGARKDGGEK